MLLIYKNILQLNHWYVTVGYGHALSIMSKFIGVITWCCGFWRDFANVRHTALPLCKSIVDCLTSSPSIPNEKRPYSPDHLTKDDVTNIWFKIFQRFMSAVSIGKIVRCVMLDCFWVLDYYPVCHGTGENRQKLAASLQQQKEKLGINEDDKWSLVNNVTASDTRKLQLIFPFCSL